MLSGVNPNLAEGLPHLIEGFIIFVIALVMLFLLHVGISRVAKWFSLRNKAVDHA